MPTSTKSTFATKPAPILFPPPSTALLRPGLRERAARHEERGLVRGGLLLHPSAIEAATSAMEVMAVAATNAALLVRQRLQSELLLFTTY